MEHGVLIRDLGATRGNRVRGFFLVLSCGALLLLFSFLLMRICTYAEMSEPIAMRIGIRGIGGVADLQ